MELYVGAKVRVNKKGMRTDSTNGNAWKCIASTVVNQIKLVESLTVTKITDTGSLVFLEDPYCCYWPTDMFEVIPEEDCVVLSRKEKDILKGLLQSQVDIYTRLIEKLK